MTKRLYYNDSYLTGFSAVVTEQTTHKAQPAVILNQTAFYPGSGGQPNDTGLINKVKVVDVVVRDDDAAILHILEDSPTLFESGQAVTCVVDWARRFDHMQQHTGQHILTQAFIQTSNAKTVSFHLSPDSVTIDLDMSGLTEKQLQAAEDLANAVIQDDKTVVAAIRQADEQDDVRMRKLPKHIVTDGLRVVEIEGYDKTACGGTHVSRTGEIGLLKLIKSEKRGDKTRVEFRCGQRALADYGEKHQVMSGIAAEMNCRFNEVPELVGKLRDELKAAQSALKDLREQLVGYEAERLLNEAPNDKGYKLICASFDGRDAGELRLLASRLAAGENVVALLGAAGEKSQLIFARSANLMFDMGALLKNAATQLGGRGGGQPAMAQGGGVKANLEQIQALLQAIAAEL
ncbi:MAG: DHHA1 domain-containing protein [Chloroflexi bacterium]|nr:DHHA1 domain-containing protein [Chloroflexota bacterium]MCC6891458.1 hypothetical protein [Anaerolineae bacterium]